MRAVLKNKYENYKPREGIINKKINEADEANQSRAEECDIKKIIEKYGIIPTELMKKANEPLYLDMRGSEMTLNERLQMHEQVANYFETLPAKIRNKYNGNPNMLYNAIISGEYGTMVEDNILTENHKEELELMRTEKERKIQENIQMINNLTNQINELKGASNEQNNTEKNTNMA